MKREESVTLSDRIGMRLTDIIRIFSPERAVEMEAARAYSMMMRGYDGAKLNRGNRGKAVSDGSANQELLLNSNLVNLRKYSRELTRNSPIAKALKKALAAHIIGTGYSLQATATDEHGKPLAALNDQIERLWKIWTENPKEIDVARKKTFTQFLNQAIGQMCEGGESFINKVYIKDANRLIGLKLEAVDNDLLPESLNDESKRIIGGIELDGNGAPSKYWFTKSYSNLYHFPTPGDYNVKSANDIIHCFIEDRPGQLRGEPWFAPIITFLQTAHRAIEAELYTLEVQACLSVLHTNKTGYKGKFSGSETSGQTDDAGNRTKKLGVGAIIEVAGGDNFTVVDPKRPGNTFTPFIDKIVEYCCAALDLSYAKGTKDYSKASFSSLRMADQDDRRHLMPIQKLIVDDIIKPIYEEFLYWCVLSGHITAPDFVSKRRYYTQAIFTPQAYDYTDPLKDAAADREQLASGTVSLKGLLDERGRNWKEHIDELAMINDYAREKGVSLSFSDKAPSQAQTAGDMKKDSTKGNKNGQAE